jgi:ABC-type glycerol-3-phosphate transport system substrate-binding protein
MKKKLFLLPILSLSALVGCGGKGGFDGNIVSSISETDFVDFIGQKTTISFWNPITGPDSGNLQNLVKYWNDNYGQYVKIDSDSLSENDHYTRITTSFSNNATADLCLIHSSRIPHYVRSEKLRDMSSIVSSVGISKDQYLDEAWEPNVINDKLYGLTWDIIPTVMYYNKDLIPEGYLEADIHSDSFTVDTMIEMMKKAFVNDPMVNRRIYGASFNYAFTENPFLSFLYQLGGKPVDVSNPVEPLFNSSEGVLAAEALMKIPHAKSLDGARLASESGSNHLNIFRQGRALFTIDGLWSANDLVKNTKVNTGIAFLPKVNENAVRNTFGDSHVFASFVNKNNSPLKDKALGLILKFLSENSLYWCEGGKVAVRHQDINDAAYLKMPWAFVSSKLDKVCPPEKVYTFNTITNPIGEACSLLCEGTRSDVQATLDEYAGYAKDLAKEL